MSEVVVSSKPKSTRKKKKTSRRPAAESDAKPTRAPRKRKPKSQQEAVAAPPPGVNGFAKLGLSAELISNLDEIGFHTPTDIQRELIPPALEGRDCLGQARTGTGKTAAFTLPMLSCIQRGEGIQALVLVPTRELAAQVGEHVRMLSPKEPPDTLVVYGGTRITSNLRDLRKNVDIVVGTPGRVLDLLHRRVLKLDHVKLAVLDEVDRMLDIGFRDDIRRIMSKVKGNRQTIFVSATVTDSIRRLAREYMRNAAEINVSADHLTVDEIEQEYVSVEPKDKLQTLRRLLKCKQPRVAIVFTRTKRGASDVARKLKHADVACAEIHGNLNQSQRTRVLAALRSGKIHVLVATDLASRGLDVMDVTHIVNYDIPEDPSVYIHRIGRSARMGNDGHAVTFVTSEQGGELTEIEMLINRELTRVDGVNFAPQVHDAPAPTLPPAPKAERFKPRPPAVVDETAAETGAKPRKTLGGRFPRSRGRRRR